MTDAADFYTGLVAEAYALLKGETFDPARYAAFVRESGEPALEVGCGDGHPLFDLVADGLDVDGVDSSRDMIDRARRVAQAAGLPVELHVARMEEMDLGRRYRSIYLAGPTFELLPDDTACLAALAAFRRHLARGGRVMIPLWIPEATAPAAFGTCREATDDAGARLSFTPLSEELDHAQRTRRTQVRYGRTMPDGSSETVDREWVIHWQTPTTLRGLAHEAGLEVVAVDPDQGGDDGELPSGAEFTAYLKASTAT